MARRPKKAVLAVTGKIKTLTCRKSQNLSLEALLHRLNQVVRGWTQYFRNGVSSATFGYLRAVLWKRVTAWIRAKHARITWKELRRKYCAGGWWPTIGEVVLYHPERTSSRWYTYRGTRIPSPWPVTATI
jgi:RNA-directed DNA polymerase